MNGPTPGQHPESAVVPRALPAMTNAPDSARESDADDRLWASEFDEDASEEPPQQDSRDERRTGVHVDDWRRKLLTKVVKTRSGEAFEVVLPCHANIEVILRDHPAWRGVLALDVFSERIVLAKPPPWPLESAAESGVAQELREHDFTRMVTWLSREEGLHVTSHKVIETVPVVSDTNVVHPVRDYLQSLRWDGKRRVESWLATYCGVPASEYSTAVGRCWMISAVARIMRPGCQVDTMIVFEGPQGGGKSSLFRALVPHPSLYSETGITIGDKDSYQMLRGVWIYLLDELASTSRADVTKVKNFVTSPKDRYRPSYARSVRDFPRQNVFAGTTNAKEYLIDTTGNRRFWPVRAGELDPVGVARDRDQLWAEALAFFESGEPWHVNTVRLRKLCEHEQAERVQDDPWTSRVADWLAAPFGEWEPSERDGAPGRRAPYDDSEGVLTIDVLMFALGKRPGDITKGDEMRIAEVLRTLGYEKGARLREGGARVRRFKPRVQVGTEAGTEGGDDATP